MIFLWILFFQLNIIQTSYIRYLSLINNINHLTYYSPLKWFYVASINSISIYDYNLTLLQNISIQNSDVNDDDICQINPCQCLNNLTNNNDDSISDRNRRSKLIQSSLNLQNSFDQNNYNLILYLEKNTKIKNKPYLIDCWSLQQGSCIVRNALNLSDIYYQPNKKNSAQKFLFNTDSTIPNHIFPFHFKLNKCNNTPIYLFLTSTLKKNFILSNPREKSDDLTDLFYLQCLEQAQRRTIALRAFVYDDEIKKSQDYVNKTMVIPRNITVVKESIMKRQTENIESFINKTRSSSSNNTKSPVTSNISISQSSSTISDDHVTNTNNNNNNTLSSINLIREQGPFLNINDYCPEQLSVVRSIYTDFFERESSDKFRLFQDIIYDKNDSSIYLFTNQQYVSKIIRLCEGQISFRHYVELEINCGNEYNLIQKVKLIKFQNKQYLLTIASKSKTFHSLEPSINSHSAICLYDLDQIRNAFIDNIIDLSKGNISLGMAWLHGESVIVR
jgi:hypothetical protein